MSHYRYEEAAMATDMTPTNSEGRSIDSTRTSKEAMKRGMMQQLLTGQTRLPGFSGDWAVRQIRDFAQVRAGGTPATAISVYWGAKYHG